QRQLRDHRFGEEVLLALFELQQALEVVGQCRIVLAQRGEAARAHLRLQLEQGVEQGRQALPAVGIHRRGARAPPQSDFSEASRYSLAFCQSRRMLRSERLSSSAIS